MTVNYAWTLAAAGAWLSVADAQQPPSQQPPSQQPIPVRQLAIEATSTESFANPQLLVWQWPDGGVVVTHRTRAGRLMLFDKDLTFVRVIVDSSITAIGMVPFGSFIALPYAGDTTVVVDPGNSALIYIDRDGRQVRLVALPRGQDARNIATGYYPQFVDPKGRLVYRGSYPRAPAAAGAVAAAAQRAPEGTHENAHDSTAVVRADYDRRAVDTLIAARIQLGQIDITPRDEPRTRRTVKVIPNTGFDDWAMLTDGSIAVVRYHDYHIDWVYADGSRASTPKMPFDWRRLSDEEKQARIDTTRTQQELVDERLESMLRARAPVIEELLPPRRVYATLAEIPDYFPPLRGTNTLTPDADNRLWITPSTSLQARGGLLMDVVNKQGVLEERVQLPPNAAIAGFGKGGVVFLRIVREDRTNVLVRARIVR